MVVGGSSQSKRFESSPGPTVDLIRAAIVDRPLEHIQMPSPHSIKSGCLIPGAALAPEPLQHLQVTTLSCISAHACIPRTALAPEPSHDLPVTVRSCTSANSLIPRTALAPEPLQCLQMTTMSCTNPCPFIPRAALTPEPLQCLQVATDGGIGKEFLIQLEPILSFQPLQGLELASARYEEEKEVRIQTRRRRDCEKEDLPAALVISGLSFGAALRSSCSRGR